LARHRGNVNEEVRHSARQGAAMDADQIERQLLNEIRAVALTPVFGFKAV
jgi:hypothetical protein